MSTKRSKVKKHKKVHGRAIGLEAAHKLPLVHGCPCVKGQMMYGKYLSFKFIEPQAQGVLPSN